MTGAGLGGGGGGGGIWSTLNGQEANIIVIMIILVVGFVLFAAIEARFGPKE